MINLLLEPLINVRTPTGTDALSLPETLAALARDEVEDFRNLRAFQEHTWHCLLVQLGALAMVSSRMEQPATSSGPWLQALDAMTRQEYPGQEPWQLCVEDQSLPAFLQPPTMEPDFVRRCPTDPTPDTIDLTVGSRRHDVKSGIAAQPEHDHWIYALVSTQTANGHSGRDLYRISRMNSGFGNRHIFSITPSTRWGPHVIRDMTILAGLHRQHDPLGHLLLWTRPWSGAKDESIPLDTLEPRALYIEICRRLRLFEDDGGQLQAARGTSKSPRIDDQGALGDVGDPWTLTRKGKATTVSDRGFSCRAVAAYLNPAKNNLPLLARHHPDTDQDRPMFLVARALSRGQGKTTGFHSLTIPISNTMAAMLDSGSRQELLAQAAEARVAIIAELQRILSGALRAYAGTADEAPYYWSGQLESQSAEAFWSSLQAELDAEDPAEERRRWTHQVMVPKAASLLRSAHKHLNPGTSARYSAVTASEDIFRGRIRNSKALPQQPVQDAQNQEQNADTRPEEATP